MTNAFTSHMRMKQALVGVLIISTVLFSSATLAHADGQDHDNGDGSQQQSWSSDQGSNQDSDGSQQWSSDGNAGNGNGNNGGDNSDGNGNGGNGDDGHHHDHGDGGNGGDNGNGGGYSGSPTPTGGTLTIEKDTIDGNGTFTFNITDGASFNENLPLTTTNYLAISNSVALTDGSYAVTEAPTTGWYLKKTICQNADGIIGTDITDAGVQISMTDGENVTCAFTNVFEIAPPATTTASTTGDGGTGTTTPPDNGGGTGSTTPPTDGGGDSSSTPPVAPPVSDSDSFPNGGGGGSSGQFVGGGNGGGGSTLVPQVLGASTGPTTSCVPPLDSFMRQGQVSNDPSQVDALQAFLNQNLGLNIPVTGTFDATTTQDVDTFQLKYSSDVLAPWVQYGLPNAQTPTGYVYKLTEWKINSLSCPNNDIPTPIIP